MYYLGNTQHQTVSSFVYDNFSWIGPQPDGSFFEKLGEETERIDVPDENLIASLCIFDIGFRQGLRWSALDWVLVNRGISLLQ